MSNADRYELINQIELHYFFSDGSHSLDAFTRNKCESEFLFIVKEVLKTLDIKIQIETVAIQEGGVKEWWKFLGDNGVQIGVIISIIGLIIALLPSSDAELDDLKKQELRLSIEKHKLEIKKLQNEQEAANFDVDGLAQSFNTNLKVVKHRSNFYETMMKIDKITHLETSYLHNNKIVKSAQKVDKNDFYRYVVADSDLPMEIIENAYLEIISPVLKQQSYRWRGIYKGEPIDFYMGDKKFKQSVFNREILFQNGFSIICVLQVQRTLNELGNLNIKKYTVSTVLSTVEEGIQSDTQQGKKYLAQKKKDSSPTLFD